eukprot:431961_1
MVTESLTVSQTNTFTFTSYITKDAVSITSSPPIAAITSSLICVGSSRGISRSNAKVKQLVIIDYVLNYVFNGSIFMIKTLLESLILFIFNYICKIYIKYNYFKVIQNYGTKYMITKMILIIFYSVRLLILLFLMMNLLVYYNIKDLSWHFNTNKKLMILLYFNQTQIIIQLNYYIILFSIYYQIQTDIQIQHYNKYN